MSDSERPAGEAEAVSEAGKELADPETMSTNKSDQTDAQARKIGKAINGFDGLYARLTGQAKATVLSTRNKGITAYRVDITTLECEKRDGTSCEDLEFNCSGQQVCDHLAAAIHAAPRKPDLGLESVDGMVSMLSMAREAAQSAQSTADSLRAARNAHAQESAANASESGSNDTQNDDSGGSGYDVETLRADLKDAFEYNGFQVESMDTGTYEGTDQIKFEIQHQSFDRLKEVTSECEMVGYDGDMNALDVGDVESYINGVLG